jgi:hypothetical protein
MAGSVPDAIRRRAATDRDPRQEHAPAAPSDGLPE